MGIFLYFYYNCNFKPLLTLRCMTFYIWLEYFFSDSFDRIKYGKNSFKNPDKKDMVLGPKISSGHM